MAMSQTPSLRVEWGLVTQDYCFSKLLQLPVATVSTLLTNQSAEFKSCNLIGWCGYRMLQELGKMQYAGTHYFTEWNGMLESTEHMRVFSLVPRPSHPSICCLQC